MLAQVPGADKALELASQKGYETYVLCMVLLGCLVLVGMLFRWFIKSFDDRAKESVNREENRVKEGVERENRLAKRIDMLEDFVNDTLIKQVQETTTALRDNTMATTALANALEAKPCLLEREHQFDIVKNIADRVKNKIESPP